MAVLSKTTKGKLGLAAAGTLLKNPRATKRATKVVAKATAPAAKGGLKVTKAIAKRKARGRIEDLGDAARGFGAATRGVVTTVATYGPQAAQALGWVEPPKRKRTAPRVLVGIVIGATGMYLLEPGAAGREHRAQLAKLAP
jgi:hypothetical protein